MMINILWSHPSLGWLYVFSLFPPRPLPQELLPLTSELFELNLRYLAQKKNIYGSGEMYSMTLPWPWLWHRLAQKFACLHDKLRTTHQITTKHGSLFALIMVITWLDFGEVLLETFILANFLYKMRMCFFKVKHYFGHISGMVCPIDVKRKGSAWVGYSVQYVTFTFDLTHDLEVGCFKVKFSK